MFVDESGTHNLLKVDNNYPVFVLAGCIFEKNYYEVYVDKLIKDFKIKIFKNENIILHTKEITRNENEFVCLKDKNIRKEFYKELNNLIINLNFKIIAVCIKINEHKKSIINHMIHIIIHCIF